jgi:serine/threonine-protein kinase
MSPEQIAGESDLDGRSDQYSLACVLYEMLAGQPPFTGHTMERLYYQQLMETPPTITRFRSPLPAHVVAAIRRALSKARTGRFENTTDFAMALSAPATDPDRRSIAVLPFLNMSNDPENEYFADGITEDVIAQLSKIRALQVVSRASVMPFKKRDESLRDIASKLRVGHVVDGSVRKAGSRVRIVAQLIEAEPDKPLWSETFDRDLTDIFAIQSEVAVRIANALQASLTSDEQQRIDRRPTENLVAYQHYLLGRQAWSRFTTEGMQKAIELYERAVEFDPGFAQAFAGIAVAYAELGESGALAAQDAMTRARAAVERALELDPDLSSAHATLGHIKTIFEFDWRAAEQALMRAIELSPSNADAWDFLGRLTSAQERFDEALQATTRAHELDPVTHRSDVLTAFIRAGRFDEAIEAGRLAIELRPDDARLTCTIGWAHFLKGDRATGMTFLERAVTLAPGNTIWLAQCCEACGLAGDQSRARAMLAQLHEKARHQYVSPYHFAYAHTGLGEFDEAVSYLEQAYEQRSGAVYGIKGSFLFHALHQHPRFIALLHRMNLA